MTAFSPVSAQTKARVAVFIDGDHIPPSYRPTIAAEAARLGQVVSTQLFCDLSLRADWAAETGIDATHCKGRPGKNSADMTLCIAALDLAYRGLATSFLIASNDRDFEPLIRHLHRMGFSALQIKTGLPPAPPVVKPTPAPQEARAPTPEPSSTPLLEKVRAAIKAHGDSDGIAISLLNTVLQREGVRISQEPEKTWRGWFLSNRHHFTVGNEIPYPKVRLAR